MNKFGELIAPDTVRFERMLPGPIERVWAYLTESDKRAQWFCSGETELRVGGHIDLHFDNSQLSPLDDVPPPESCKDMPATISFTGEVTACETPRLLTFIWREPDGYSEVSYELTEQNDGVRLVLTHRRLEPRSVVVTVCSGWHTHLDILEAVLTGSQPQPYWARYSDLETQYDSRIEAAD